MKRRQRNLIVAAVVLVVVCLGVFVLVWGGFLAPKPQAFTPHYLVCQGEQTKIFVEAEATSYEVANQTYVSADGVTVTNGSILFTINLTLRNDYSSDNPPPNTGSPVAPVDGTAYIRLKAILFDKEGQLVPAVNISPYDFPSPADQTGIVLASGQTGHAQLVLATYLNTVTSYSVILQSVADTITS